MLYAIKNKRTGRLLVVGAEKATRHYDYEQPFVFTFLEVRESKFQDTIFVTTNKKIAYALAKTGHWNDELAMSFGHGETKIELKDLQVVQLTIKTKPRSRKHLKGNQP